MPGALPWSRSIRLQVEPCISRLLPPRSMVGQLPLEQPIGVRIPGGQPNSLLNGLAKSRKIHKSHFNCLELI